MILDKYVFAPVVRRIERRMRASGELEVADAARQLADVLEKGEEPIGCEYPTYRTMVGAKL